MKMREIGFKLLGSMMLIIFGIIVLNWFEAVRLNNVRHELYNSVFAIVLFVGFIATSISEGPKV